MLGRALGSSRYVVLIAVVSTLVSSMALLIYGALMEIGAVIQTVLTGTLSTKGGKALALSLIEATDIFLIGIVLFIFSQGLYILFIDETLPVPAWLRIHDLDDLKGQLVSVVIAALAVIFLGHVVQWEGQPEILGLGTAVALVVGALAFFLYTKPGPKA